MAYKLYAKNINILPYSNNITWSSDTDTLGIQLSFDSLYDLSEGTIVSLHVNNKEHIRAIVIKKSESKFKFNYTCMDYSSYLKNEVIKQFNKTAASTAITSLLNEYGIKNNIVNIPTIISEIYKDKSIAEIIDDILEKAEKEQGIKYFKEMQINTVVISKASSIKITPKIFISKDITVNSSIEELKNKVIIVSSGEKNNKVLAVAQDKSTQAQVGLMQMVETVDEKEVARAQNIANNLLKANNKIFYDTSFDVLGIKDAETIKANRLIQIRTGTLLNGWYKIKSATHTLSNNKHTVNISLEW